MSKNFKLNVVIDKKIPIKNFFSYIIINALFDAEREDQ